MVSKIWVFDGRDESELFLRHPLELMFQRWRRGDGRQASIKKLLNAA